MTDEVFQQIDKDLRILYGSTLVDYSIRFTGETETTFSMKDPPVVQAITSKGYSLNVVLSVSIAEILRLAGPQAFTLIDQKSRVPIGKFIPQSVTQQQEFKTGNRITVASFYFKDIQEFAKELNDTAWAEFNDGMNKLLDEKLND